MKLNLLFTKDGLQHQLGNGRNTVSADAFFTDEALPQNSVQARLAELLATDGLSAISVVSALNHFTLVPEGFSRHDLGYKLINYNARADEATEELMLSVNKKYGVQFYYSFPKIFYVAIKDKKLPTNFNFSGEKFLSAIVAKDGPEIHINLYHNQCEFFALEKRRILLYNNLDVNSEVDFLYFIMFTLSKIGFGLNDTTFYVYGETTENSTFISELQKFVKKLKIVYDNLHHNTFILS